MYGIKQDSEVIVHMVNTSDTAHDICEMFTEKDELLQTM